MKTPVSRNLFLKELFRIITCNLGLKCLSILFAFVLFFIVRTDREIIFERTARIKIVTLPSMTVVGPSERFVNMTLRVQNSVFSLPPSDAELTGVIDITTKEPGRLNVKITEDNFPRLARQYQLTIDRPYLEVEIDRIITKNLPIQVVIKGEPASGLSLSKVTVEPDHMRISGAHQDLFRLALLTTSPIDVTGTITPITAIVPIDVSNLESLRLPTNSVRVNISLETKKFNRTFRSVPIELMAYKGTEKNNHLEIRPSVIDVEISGDPEVLKKLNPSDVRAYIDGSDLVSGWQDKKVTLKIPTGVSLIKMIPDTVFVFRKK